VDFSGDRCGPVLYFYQIACHIKIKNPGMKRNILTLIISSLLIILFVYTAISKYADLENFQSSLEESPLIGSYSTFISYTLPLLELIIALLLMVPQTRLAGFYASFLLMFIFTLYICYMLLFTPDLPCSCGGVISEMTWTQHMIFNICFTVLSFVGAWLQRLLVRDNRKQQTVSYTYK
jgi:hypothetical protein